MAALPYQCESFSGGKGDGPFQAGRMKYSAFVLRTLPHPTPFIRPMNLRRPIWGRAEGWLKVNGNGD